MWRCPCCGGKEYSAAVFRDKAKVKCIYCYVEKWQEEEERHGEKTRE